MVAIDGSKFKAANTGIATSPAPRCNGACSRSKRVRSAGTRPTKPSRTSTGLGLSYGPIISPPLSSAAWHSSTPPIGRALGVASQQARAAAQVGDFTKPLRPPEPKTRSAPFWLAERPVNPRRVTYDDKALSERHANTCKQAQMSHRHSGDCDPRLLRGQLAQLHGPITKFMASMHRCVHFNSISAG